MIQEAEQNAEADKKAKTLIEARNNADGALHSIKKDFEEHKSALTEEDKTAFETAVTEVETAVTGEDPEAIQKSVETLFEKAQPVMTAKQNAEQAKTATPEQPKEGDVVDAEFKEV
jgi:molecular chaperone DnaK